jgi:hypothetical protein
MLVFISLLSLSELLEYKQRLLSKLVKLSDSFRFELYLVLDLAAPGVGFNKPEQRPL